MQQLQILFNKPNNNFKDILISHFVSKKGYIFVHNNAKLDIKMISVLNVLCKYKKKLKQSAVHFSR